MQYQLFQYPLPVSGELEELNGFLASHRIAVVSHHVVSNAAGGMLVFIVEYIDALLKTTASRPPKVDYREKLSEPEFAVFSRLRDERKRIAEEEGVPVYAIFTNAQLAEIVTRRARSDRDMLRIEGIGKAKVEKYAVRLLPLLTDVDDLTVAKE